MSIVFRPGFRRDILWPPIFQNNAEIDQCPQRLEKTLDPFLEVDVRLDWAEMASCGCVPPFNLPHQGRETFG